MTPRPTTTGRARRGFTLMEMMVSLLIAGIMTGLIYVIFNSVSEGVSRGIHVSTVIQNSRMVGDQLQRDMIRMVPPGDPNSESTGVLVVTQGVEQGVPMPEPRSADFELNTLEDIRRDQLAFIRYTADPSTATTIKPMTGDDVEDYTHAARGDYARVWYGHVERPDPVDTGLNWILGRQALLLTAWDTNIDSNVPSWYVNEPFYDSQIPSGNEPAGAPNPTLLQAGHTDVFMDVGAFGGSPGPPPDRHPVQRGLEFLMAPSTGVLTPNSGNYSDYREQAHRLAFGLLNNPLIVDPAFSTLNSNAENPLNPWHVNRTHAAFMENVSDVAVEFAADIDPADGDVDRVPSDISIAGITVPADSIKWYGHYYNDPAEDERRLPGGGTGGFDPSLPVVFKVDPAYAPYDDGDPNPPQVEQTSGGTVDMTAAAATFVWMNDETGSAFVDWPYLLRVRYRLHDKVGRYRSSLPTGDGGSEPVNGRWFEQILPVRRE